MRARRESRFWAEAGAARRTVKIRTWQTRDIGLRSQDRGKFSKVTAQNGTCEALAPRRIVTASYCHHLDFTGDDPCFVIVFCGSPALPCSFHLCHSAHKPPPAPFKATSGISKGHRLPSPR